MEDKILFLTKGCEDCPPSIETGSGERDDCISLWKEGLKKAEIDLNTKAAIATQKEEAYTNAYAWEVKLKTYVDNLNLANEKYKKVQSEVSVFITQLESIVCKNTDYTTEAFKILLCQAKAIFMDVYRQVSIQGPVINPPTGTKQEPVAEDEKLYLIQLLKTQIECHKNLTEKDKQELLTCVGNYADKMMAIYALQEVTLKKLLETFKAALAVQNHICFKDSGLKQNLTELQNRFKFKIPAKTELIVPKQEKAQTEIPSREVDAGGIAKDTPDDSGEASPCGNDITNPDWSIFPIDGVDGSDYYKVTTQQYQTAQTRSKVLFEEWNSARELSNEALARKVGLSEALKAAQAAEEGK